MLDLARDWELPPWTIIFGFATKRKTMKLFVKPIRGKRFQIEVNPGDLVSDVKKNIENVQGAYTYPAVQQVLCYKGKLLGDGTTLKENKVEENDSVGIYLRGAVPENPELLHTAQQPVGPVADCPIHIFTIQGKHNLHSQMAGDRINFHIQEIPKIGFVFGRGRHRDLLQLFPQGLPDTEPGTGPLDFLCNNPDFNALRYFVQLTPQRLKDLLEVLAHSNPDLSRLVRDHNSEFNRLINEPIPNRLVQVLDAQADFFSGLDRLEAMGFDKDAVNVLIGCGYDVKLAEKFLQGHTGSDSESDSDYV